jgi:hypothetical protein
MEDEKSNGVQGLISGVLPVQQVREVATTRQDVNLPFTKPSQRAPSRVHSVDETTPNPLRETSEELEDIVIDAMESISRLSFRESMSNQTQLSPGRKKFASFSVREKSERLVRHCSSWTELDQTKRRFEPQIPATSLRLEIDNGDYSILSLRRAAVEGGAAAPFQQILSWLSDQEDYFTAASLALDLLRDAETLRHLWVASEKIDDESERSKLEGLLDGVAPVQGSEDDQAALVTQLADMTVGCLTKGGYAMSSSLERFLEQNTEYDASRACLMLVATTASAVSGDRELESSVMGKGYQKDENHIVNIMWPVKCLLKIGVSRNVLVTALLLLNATIPDELRRRERSAVPGASLPSLEMCKTLVSFIVASSPDAAELLLDLVDETSRVRYWQSLDHQTRLEFSLISVAGKRSLLRQPEVRAWVLEQLQKTIESEDAASSQVSHDIMPTEWLKNLVLASIANAGCHVEEFAKEGTNQMTEPLDDEIGLVSFAQEINRTRAALVPERGSGGLDFDLLISSLLILEHRDMLWNDLSKTSTRSLLNAACYLAGRRSVEGPLFPTDMATLMRQCTLTGDVEAGANLIGGKNGLVLECCHILIEQLGMEMEDAERFLVSESISEENLGSSEKQTSFSIHPSHRHLLWLLQQHVLEIRTYGEFETTHLRGKVDPVFAATVCFRTWWALERDNNLSESTVWLMRWMREKLSIQGNDPCKTSPHRLACAALVRALIWPSQPDDEDTYSLLADRLQMDGHFLVQLAQSCCGLVEALPPAIAEQGLSKALAHPSDAASTGSSPRSPGRGGSRDLDLSFLTADSSFEQHDRRVVELRQSE